MRKFEDTNKLKCIEFCVTEDPRRNTGQDRHQGHFYCHAANATLVAWSSRKGGYLSFIVKNNKGDPETLVVSNFYILKQISN